MTITEFITELLRIRDEFGDVEVMSDSEDGALPVEFGGVEDLVEDETEKRTKALMLYGLEIVGDG